MNLLTLFSGILLSVFAQNVSGTVYMTDYSQRKVIELKGRSQPCLIYTDKTVIDKILRGSGIRHIQKMSYNDLEKIGKLCRDTEQMNKIGGFIYPGTKWCGPGNIASSYNDLGTLTEEDKCCREHDHCPNQLEPGQCRHGICNTSPFTSSHCDCDKSFKECLRQVNSDSANTIGTLYFNIVQVTCFTDRRSCPQYMRGCRGMQFYGMSPFVTSRKKFYKEKEELVSNFVSGLLSEFFRYGAHRF